jgi:hypothetical protein
MDIENPINIEVIPVAEVIPLAEVVRIKVMSKVLVEPKRETNNSFCNKLNYFAFTSVSVLLMISIVGGVITFMIWLACPNLLGAPNEQIH